MSHPLLTAPIGPALFRLAGPTTAFMVTEADGTFYLDLPPGPHALQLWHERLGERKDSVEVVAGETALRDLSMSPR